MPDLRRLRSDLGYFAHEVGAPLTGWQLAALGLERRITVLLAGRQLGKSRSLALLGLWWAARRSGQRVLLVSAGEAASRRLLGEVRRIAAGSPLLEGSLADEQAGLVTLSNGSELRSVPASERQVRGWTVDLLLVDEGALVGDDLLLSAALPTVAARPDARVVLAGTPTVASGAFYDLARAGELGEGDVSAHRWVARAAGGPDDAPWVSPSLVEAARAAMSGLRFDAEFRAVFAGTADAFVSPTVLERALRDFEQTPLAALRGPGRLAAAVDWGEREDRTVFTAVGRLPAAGPPVYGVALSQAWPSGYPLPQAIAEIAASPAHLAWIVSESNGLGGPLSDLLFRQIRRRSRAAGGGTRPRVVLVEEASFEPERPRPRPRPRPPEGRGFVTTKVRHHVTAQSKAAAYGALRIMLERQQLLVPRSAEQLIRELLTLRIDLTAAGTERVEAAGTAHDDAADSLALSLRPYKPPGAGWRVRLAELAERGSGGALVPEEPLEVPARPPWQSVAGHEVSAPPAAGRAEAGPDPVLAAVRARVAAALQSTREETA